MACPDPNPNVDGGIIDACPKQSRETVGNNPVAYCEEAHSAAPFVRPPADSESGGVKKIYGGITRNQNQEQVFQGRSDSFPIASASWLSAELSSNRAGYFLYLADVRAGAVEKVTPVARIDDRVFARLIAGKILEGTASARSTDGGMYKYEYTTTTVPMRIRFDDAPATTESDRETQFPRYALGGRIENSDGGSRGTDGGCFPALTSLGGASPVFDATAAPDRVTLRRHPNMHGGGDDVFTLEWPTGVSGGANMGGGLFIPVSALIQSAAPVLTEATSSPHGVPWGAPSTDMNVVSGGGAACTP